MTTRDSAAASGGALPSASARPAGGETRRLIVRLACPACRAVEASTLLRTPYADTGIQRYLAAYYPHVDAGRMARDLAGGEYAVLECAACGLLYQRMVPDEALAAEIYDEWIIEDDHLGPDAPRLPIRHYEYLVSEVFQLLAFQQRRGAGRRPRVLDFGMGWGRWLQVAQALGAEVYGTELSKAKCAHAAKIGVPLLGWDEIERERFDVIATEQVLEHITQPAELIGRLVRSLDVDGVLKISLPNSAGVKAGLVGWSWAQDPVDDRRLMPMRPLEHINGFPPATLDRFAAQFGLRRVGIPLGVAYAYSVGWTGPVGVMRNLLRPVYRYWAKRGGYALFARRG